MRQTLLSKIAASFLVTVTVFAAFCLICAAASEYETLAGISTTTVNGWEGGTETTVSVNAVKNGDSPAVSFTSVSKKITARYVLNDIGSALGEDVSKLILRVRLFISDISAIKTDVGYFAFKCGDGSGFEWSVSDLSLKTGWNDITLNFRTATLAGPSKPAEEETEDAKTEETEEEDGETAEETGGEETENGQPDEKTPAETLASVTEFMFEFEKSPVKDATVAFSEISVNIRAREAPPEKPEPITDKTDLTVIVVALAAAALITVTVVIFCVSYARKEMRRRRREIKKRRTEQ